MPMYRFLCPVLPIDSLPSDLKSLVIQLTLPITLPIFICTFKRVKFTANSTNVSHADSLSLISDDICLSVVKLQPLPISGYDNNIWRKLQFKRCAANRGAIKKKYLSIARASARHSPKLILIYLYSTRGFFQVHSWTTDRTHACRNVLTMSCPWLLDALLGSTEGCRLLRSTRRLNSSLRGTSVSLCCVDTRPSEKPESPSVDACHT